MIKKKLNQIYILLQDILAFIEKQYFAPKIIDDTKMLYINFDFPNLYHRYFYTLLKNFKLAGYSMIYPMNFSKFRNLRNGDPYLSLILKEKNFLNIKNLKKKNYYIEFNDDMFSAAYYDRLFLYENQEKESFHIPMTFHPYMYKYWNLKIEEISPRLNSIFCFGNFDREAYKIVHKAPFNVIDRASIIDFLSSFKNFVSVNSKDELQGIIDSRIEQQYIFAEKSNFEIPFSEIREITSKFRFFLCCPGVFAPLSHNLAEAMSCGTIPIIEENYANTVYPPLENGKNAFIFRDLQHLEDLIVNQIFNLSEENFLVMKQNVTSYFMENMHPDGFSKQILDNLNKKKLFLNASERSVKLIKIKNDDKKNIQYPF